MSYTRTVILHCDWPGCRLLAHYGEKGVVATRALARREGEWSHSMGRDYCREHAAERLRPEKLAT